MKIEIDTHFLRTVIVGEKITAINIFLWMMLLVFVIIIYIANAAVMIMKGYNQWYDYCINIFMLISIIFNIRVIYRRLTLSKTTKLLLEQYIRNAEDMALQKHE
jgi:hypothetical protein